MKHQPSATPAHLRGRGITSSLPNRFEKLHVELDAAALHDESLDPSSRYSRSIPTEFFRDESQTIISKNDSPDIGFNASLNPYRGCEHGCAYCYARPYHEYLGFSSGLDFETKIMVKHKAPALLEKELMSPKWIPQSLACSGVTDPYQPIEKQLQITRQCLEVLVRFRNPVGIITKNHLITRDRDLLAELASHQSAVAFISLTSLDPKLAAKLEPRASSPVHRLRAIRELSEAGIPVGVSTAPIIPGLNDHELPNLIQAAADHGAVSAMFTIVRLPYGVKTLFAEWLETHFPNQKEKVLQRIRSLRGGKLNDSEFGTRMEGTGPLAENIRQLFEVSVRRYGLNKPLPRLSCAAFRRPGAQMDLFL